MIDYAWLIPALPLLGALVAAAGGRWLKQNAHWPVVVGIGLACVVSLSLLGKAGEPVAGHHESASEGSASAGQSEHAEPPSQTLIVYRWLQLGASRDVLVDGKLTKVYDLDVPIEFRVDGLTVMMLSMVTFVATFVAVFAIGYMAGDPGYPRFFAVVGLFVFSMTGLVLSNNYLLTYAFWEGVGVCSYLLVGFWHAKPSAAAAAKKAFLVNRIGDVGFAIAIFLMWVSAPNHGLDYDNVLGPDGVATASESVRTAIAFLLFWAATAKSAQIPLYVWLPDAMEGPTPVSALIHAATMVTAGVYLLARSSVLVFANPLVPAVIVAIGGATALLAALMALTQNDLKRVLAYSTISQLGYMFMALGCGVGEVMLLAVVAAMFHLFTHAFFKALLFLGSGSVMHAMGNVLDMRRFSGLRHRMPYTFWTFAVGGASLAALPPLAGFWSKDEVLNALHSASEAAGAEGGPGWGWLYQLVYWVAVFTAFLTAFYTGRAFFKTFFGPEKLPSPDDPEADPSERLAAAHGDSHAADPHAPAGAHGDHGHGHDAHGHGDHGSHFGHESGRVMTIPLIVLAAGTVIVGLAFGPTGLFEGLLERTPSFAGLKTFAHPHGVHWPSVIIGTLVGVGGLALSWFLYGAPAAVRGEPLRKLGAFYNWSYHKFYIDEFYQAVVVGPVKALAVVCRFLDVYVVDGLVRLVAWIPRIVGRDLLAPFQNGLIQFYAGVTALGVAALLLVLLLM